MKKKADDLRRISNIFKAFAERECKGVSNLYFQLSNEISEEPTLLKLAAKCRDRQPVPNLFYGSIQYLLLKNENEELGQYYPSISNKKSSEIPIELFKAFCERRQDEIITILQNRIVQTNSINRTAYLMPIASSQFRGEKALNIIDIGTSSGLTMNFDLYEYDYQNGKQYGQSEVKVKSKIVEGSLPEFNKIVKVNRKIGVDQNPLDLKNVDNALWLKALIWPDMEQRFKNMEAAIELARRSNIELYQASDSEKFKNIIKQIPQTEGLLIYHTHVLYQFTSSERKAFRKMLDAIGVDRNFKYLAVEASIVFDRKGYQNKGVVIELTEYQNGKKKVEIVAETNGHANWIKWK